MNKLDEIIAHKYVEVTRWKQGVAIHELQHRVQGHAAPPDFGQALTTRPIGLIAEIKRRSPSVGIIRDPFNPAEIARDYKKGGAQALSVLMDEQFFGGGPDDFRIVRESVTLPMLYKEFVVDAWQVWHAASLGASALLLIVSALKKDTLASLMTEAQKAGLQVLMEVHDGDEAKVAVDLGAAIIGINNRNLKTFKTSLETTDQIIQHIPDDRIVVSESGIRDANDVKHLLSIGVDAILVGEHLLKKHDIQAGVRALMESSWMSL